MCGKTQWYKRSWLIWGKKILLLKPRLYKSTEQVKSISELGPVLDKLGTWLLPGDTGSWGRNFNTGVGDHSSDLGLNDWLEMVSQAMLERVGLLSLKVLWRSALCWWLLLDGDRGDRKVERDFRSTNDSISTFWECHSHTHPEVSVCQPFSFSPTPMCYIYVSSAFWQYHNFLSHLPSLVYWKNLRRRFPSFFHFLYFLLFLSLFLHLKHILLSQAFVKCNDLSLYYVLVFIVSLTILKITQETAVHSRVFLWGYFQRVDCKEGLSCHPVVWGAHTWSKGEHKKSVAGPLLCFPIFPVSLVYPVITSPSLWAKSSETTGLKKCHVLQVDFISWRVGALPPTMGRVFLHQLIIKSVSVSS